MTSAGSSEERGPSPEAWREFRAQLIAGGIKLTSDAATDDEQEQPQRARTIVAPGNAKLLRLQNEKLYDEYVHGAWAHISPPEPGGLMCRLPLPAQIHNYMRRDPVALAKTDDVWGALMRKKLKQELPKREPSAAAAAADGTGGSGAKGTDVDLFEQWLSNTAYCYRLVESTIRATLREMAKGQLRRSDLSVAQLQLLSMYSRSSETWQEVCLLTASSGPELAQGVVLNRPLAKAINDRQMATALVYGMSALSGRPLGQPVDDALIDKILVAFSDRGAVYLGGPDEMQAPALMVHGHDDLPGAVELSPGTRIYLGGLEAAVDGVLSGKYDPLDFRFFLGRHTALSTSEYVALACARPVALKQCLGLPKPLWHEVMELAGGELAELSRLELTKREDLELDPDE
jgi:hypothetical protein